MSKSDDLETNFLKLYYTAVAHSGWADNAASSPKTYIGFSLNTADPGDSGAANTSECTYTSIARVMVPRTTGGFTVTNNSVSPVAAVTFPAGTGGSGTAAYFTTSGATSSTPTTGATVILHSGTVTPNIVTGNGITPQLTTATAITED